MQVYVPHYTQGGSAKYISKTYTDRVFEMIYTHVMHNSHARQVTGLEFDPEYNVKDYMSKGAPKSWGTTESSIRKMLSNMNAFALRIMEMWDIQGIDDFLEHEAFLRKIYADTYWSGKSNGHESVLIEGTCFTREWKEISYKAPTAPFAVLLTTYNSKGQTALTLALDGKRFENLHYGTVMINLAKTEYKNMVVRWKHQRDIYENHLTLKPAERKKHYETQASFERAVFRFPTQYYGMKEGDRAVQFAKLSFHRVETVRDVLSKTRTVFLQKHLTRREGMIERATGIDHLYDMLEMVQVQTRNAKVKDRFFVMQRDLLTSHIRVTADSEPTDVAAKLTVLHRADVEAHLKALEKEEKQNKDANDAKAYLDKRKANEQAARRKVVDAENKARDERREKRLNKKAEEERQKEERRAARQKKKDDEAAKAAAKQKAKPVAKVAPKKKKPTLLQKLMAEPFDVPRKKLDEIEFKRIPTIRMQGEIL